MPIYLREIGAVCWAWKIDENAKINWRRRVTQVKKQGTRTEPTLNYFSLNITTQNLHSVQLFANTKHVFVILRSLLRSNRSSKPMKMTFLLFRVFWKEHEHGSYRGLLQSIAASFDVWGYRDRFLRSIVLKYDSKNDQFNSTSRNYYDILQDFAGTPKPRMSTTLPT